MALPEFEKHRVDKLLGQYCEQRIPINARHQIKLFYNIEGNKVILIQSRPCFDDPTKWTEMPVAQFEYRDTTKNWCLFAYGRNSICLPYSKGYLEKLIKELDKDPTGIFWG
jgi:hypothetical protein